MPAPIHVLSELRDPGPAPAARFLAVAGAGALAIALTVDLLLHTAPGFGRSQVSLAAAGGILLAVGALRVEGRAGLARFTGVAVLVSLLALVLRDLRIESQAFHERVVPLAVAGFLVHHWLPSGARLPFFLALSFTALGVVFGWANGAALIGTGVVLVALCHLPVRFATRVALLVGAGVVLALMRADWLPAPWPSAVWPILASMFMFRLIVYLYDLRHSTERVNIWRTLSYFFLLPNVAFPLFPVVDYATFRRTYYDEDAYRIYQRGLRWMLLGTVHLLGYRFVYQYLTLSPAEVRSGTDLTRYLVANFLLYLRVSGQFHMIAGMLHLFGFRLPETFRFFFLASSFTDFWRRINIYWKDFMMKVFHYPTYFKVRRWGETRALVLATAIVFAATWALHSYQWFWLLGEVLWSWTDVLFWATLATLLIINVLAEAKHGRARALGKQRWTARASLGLAARTVGTFATVCVLWSLWTSPTVRDWFALWEGADVGLPEVGVVALAGGVAVLALAGAIQLGAAGWGAALRAQPFWRSAVLTATASLALYLAAQPVVTARFSLRAQEVLRDLRVAELNRQDAALLRRGYYEDLIRANRFNSQLWEVYVGRPPEWPFLWETGAARRTGDFLFTEIRPLAAILYQGAPFRTNRWGMRDRDYDRLPPPNTYRVALLGSSYVMGAGVGDGETFEWLLEDKLNRAPAAVEPGRRYEILNFGVAAYSVAQQLLILEPRVLPFQPHAIYLVVHPREASILVEHLTNMARDGVAIPYDFLRSKVAAAGIDSTTTIAAAERALGAHGVEMLAWVYQRIAEVCRRHEVPVVWINLPMPGDALFREKVEESMTLARAAGFHVLDLSDVYDGYEPQSLQVAPWDRHPNATGHRVIAERLLRALTAEALLTPRPSRGLTPSAQ
ncbi:MAG: hypothetical protein HYS40_02125 [Gemmatimonadetes bacterium]|nr:hypothetical protein [Gemmatimonadota bacterium]